MTGRPVVLTPTVPPAGFPAAALGTALATAVLFTGFAGVTTLVPSVHAGSPWQGDPYAALMSLAGVLVPAVAALAAARATLCGHGPQPRHRVDQLLRAAVVLGALVGATALSDAAALALGAEHRRWTADTGWLAAALAVLVVAAGSSLTLTLRARLRRLPAPPRPGEDWLGDAVLLWTAATAHLPGPLRRAVAARDAGVAAQSVRRHVLAVVAGASVVGGLLLAAGKAAAGARPALPFAVEVLADAGGLFAFGMVADAFVHGAVPPRGAHHRPGVRGRRRAGRSAAVAAAGALPAAAALRTPIGAMLGWPAGAASPGRLLMLVLASALLSAAAVFAVASRRALLARVPGRPGRLHKLGRRPQCRDNPPTVPQE